MPMTKRILDNNWRATLLATKNSEIIFANFKLQNQVLSE